MLEKLKSEKEKKAKKFERQKNYAAQCDAILAKQIKRQAEIKVFVLQQKQELRLKARATIEARATTLSGAADAVEEESLNLNP